MRLSSLPLLIATLCNAQQYFLESSFSGPSFFENFNFWTAGDPTYGYVHYVDQAVAEQYGMINTTARNSTVWGVDTTQTLDPTANLGRFSIRLTSIQSWTHGLFVLDLEHMPANQCGAWPAFWTLGSGTWPENGEIDIIESTNTVPNNLMALHTSATPNCSVAGAGQMGTLLTDNCANGDSYTGCGVSETTPNNIGYDFNTAGGGVYAMQWTSTAIQIWFFSRDQIPASILEADDIIGPDPSTFGLPVANFQGSCDIDAHLFNHSLVFDTTFCGSYAGNTWASDGCPLIDPTNGWQSCDDFVAANPLAFTDAYWEVNYLNVYQTAPGAATTSSSSLSSVVPAVRTSSVQSVSGNAQGRSTTPTMPFPVSLTGSPSGSSFVTSASSSSSLLANEPGSSLSATTLATEPFTSGSLTSSSVDGPAPFPRSDTALPALSSPSSLSAEICTGDACTITSEVIVIHTVTIFEPLQGTPSPQQGTPSSQQGIARQEPMSAQDYHDHLRRQIVDDTITYWPEPVPQTAATTFDPIGPGKGFSGIVDSSTRGYCGSADCALMDGITALSPAGTGSQSVGLEDAHAILTDRRHHPNGLVPAPLPLPNSQSPRGAMSPSLPSATLEAESDRRHAHPAPPPFIPAGMCSVPGSSCNEHHKRDEDDASVTLPPVVTSLSVIPLPGPNGMTQEPNEKRAALPTAELLERQEFTSVVVVTVVVTETVPYYSPTHFSYDPPTKRDTAFEEDATTILNARQVPDYTPTHFSYDPVATVTVTVTVWPRKRDDDMLATVSGEEPTRARKESSDSPAMLSDYLSPHTCTPVFMLQADAAPTSVGCLAALNEFIPQSQHIRIANVTSTIQDTRPTPYARVAVPNSLFSDQMDEAAMESAASNAIWTCSTVAIISGAAAAIALWTNAS